MRRLVAVTAAVLLAVGGVGCERDAMDEPMDDMEEMDGEEDEM